MIVQFGSSLSSSPDLSNPKFTLCLDKNASIFALRKHFRGLSWPLKCYILYARPRPGRPRRPLPARRPKPRPPPEPSPNLTLRPGKTSGLGVSFVLPHLPSPRPVRGPSPRGPVLSKPGILNTSFQFSTASQKVHLLRCASPFVIATYNTYVSFLKVRTPCM
jgi:hypothetical protein